MLHENDNAKSRHKPSKIQDCFLDFMLSRQAMLCTPRTLKFYRDTLGKLLEWLGEMGVNQPKQITSRDIRAFLASYADRGCSDSYIHTYARSARTFLRFLHNESYISKHITFQMPKIGEKRLPVLSIDEVKEVIKACGTIRDKAIIMLMVDTGLRHSEVCYLNWGDIDLSTGLCLVRNGKGKKDRSVVIGLKTRRVLLKYKQKVSCTENDALFQISLGDRLSTHGLRSLMVHLSEKTGIKVSSHALRRTFVVMSLKGGMSIAHVQAIMGHATPIMTLEYAKLENTDLLEAHKEHGPIDIFVS